MDELIDKSDYLVYAVPHNQFKDGYKDKIRTKPVLQCGWEAIVFYIKTLS